MIYAILAQELKDAGFPQEGAFCRKQHEHSREHETDMPHCWCNPRKEVQPNSAIVVIHNHHDDECDYAPLRPSLDELIAACGDYFVDLIRIAGNEWKAGGGTILERKVFYNCEVTSSTPEEAVARLWLSLKKR